MAENIARCLILSDFNASNFAGYLNHDPGLEGLAVTAECGPYGQVQTLLMDPSSPCWLQPWEVMVVWTSPSAVSASFRQVLDYAPMDVDATLREVDDFARLIRQAAEKVGCVFIPTWLMPSYHRGLGMLDWKKGVGLADLLTRMNLRLSDQLADLPHVFLLDTGRWVALAGKSASTPKLWYMAKIPFGHEVFQAAAADIHAAIKGIRGQARKLIVLDLDETLWGGIVGDTGWENLQLGGHDPVGEAYVDFQRELKALTRRGIVLGIVSKNEEMVALEAIHRHPEMVLKEGDFAGWRINWSDKAQNLVELVSDLNLGLQSVVFIDDNPAERARVREQLPEVLVPEWPEDRTLYRKALLELRCFDAPRVGEEDQQRTAMYVAERQRKELHHQLGSLQDWFFSLEMKVQLESLTESNLPRTAQLLNKTNQMNLSTRRLSERELAAWAQQESNTLWSLRVTDRFGEAGLIGILGVQRAGETLSIIDFVLSCRVFGRQIEHVMLHRAVAEARRRGCREVRADYLPTPKNKPMLEFLHHSGMMQELDSTTFSWDASQVYPLPSHVELMEG